MENYKEWLTTGNSSLRAKKQVQHEWLIENDGYDKAFGSTGPVVKYFKSLEFLKYKKTPEYKNALKQAQTNKA